MPEALISYILLYGYPVIFLLVFLQEIGIPNPVPNEVILLFAGYLASAGHFSATKIIAIAILADFVGTTVLYGIFYIFGHLIATKRPKWLPVDRIESWQRKISERGKLGVFIGRMIPYVRGYTSAAAGLLKIPPRIFMPIVLGSAIVWSGGLVLAGKLLGPHVQTFAEDIGWKIMLVGAALGLIAVIFVLPKLFKKLESKKTT